MLKNSLQANTKVIKTLRVLGPIISDWNWDGNNKPNPIFNMELMLIAIPFLFGGVILT